MRIVGILQILVGALALLLPEAIFILAESWKRQDGAEPSKPYLLITRCIGAVLCAVGVLTILGVL